MKDGFYLSTYICIDELFHLLGFRVRHDQNISLWKKSGNKIELVHYWELERITGYKQMADTFFDKGKVNELINYLLKNYGLSMDDMIEVWGTPKLDTCDDYHPILDYPDIACHSIFHLYSSILFDSNIYHNESIIGLAVDGGPDTLSDVDAINKKFYCGCVSQKGKIDVFPVMSPAPLWAHASNYYKLKEGSLMALASASTSEAKIADNPIVQIWDMEGIEKAKNYLTSLIRQIDDITEKDKGTKFNDFDRRFSIEENKISMAIKEIQKMSNLIMEINIDAIVEKYGLNTKETYLSLSGGFALNCPSTSRLMDKYKFKGYVAPPCVNDGGISLGVALYAFKKKMGNDRIEVDIKHAYYGNKDIDLQNIVNNEVYKKFISNVSGLNYEQLVDDIQKAPIMWFDGSAEVGPRALGNRSILGDPRKVETSDILNRIKKRQWWRPVAPIVLEEEAGEYFYDCDYSPFMLRLYRIKEDKLSSIPAIAHLDGTARVQTINGQTNPLLYNVIKKFKEATGVPILCNTSLNDKGEPIVDKIEEAMNFALRKGINIIYINGNRVELCNHNEYTCDKPAVRSIHFIRHFSDKEKELLIKKYNPFELPKHVLLYYYSGNFKTKYDITKEKDANLLRKRVEKQINKHKLLDSLERL